ncbi:zinc ribbon domain-containing protein [Caldisericum sp.]|uniref:zinc ribbon domain-containing protein n=1 Tax=Caldisericum sp. TaxID=2499687 RepID=UPI003D0CA092
MHCPNCGAEVREDAKFCPNCGAKLSGVKVNNQLPQSGTSLFLDIAVLITAGVSFIFSIIILIGSLSVNSRMNSFVNSIISQINSMGADMSDPTSTMVIQYVRNGISGIGRFITFTGILIFLILALISLIAFAVISINRKVSKLSEFKGQ